MTYRVAVQAAFFLIAIRVVLVCRGVRRTVRWITARPAMPIGNAPSPHRLAAIVDSVASRLPWRSTCLHRALASAWLLRRYGLSGGVTIGVRRTGDTFAAHAWLAGVSSPLEHDSYAAIASWTFDEAHAAP